MDNPTTNNPTNGVRPRSSKDVEPLKVLQRSHEAAPKTVALPAEVNASEQD